MDIEIFLRRDKNKIKIVPIDEVVEAVTQEVEELEVEAEAEVEKEQ